MGCISFIIISAKLKNKLWAYFALAYTAIFVVAMLTAHDDAPIDASYEFQQGVLTVSAISWVVSIIHCFLVRREYLIGLDTITSDERREEEAERIREKYKR